MIAGGSLDMIGHSGSTVPWVGAYILARFALPAIAAQKDEGIANLIAAVVFAVPGLLLWGCEDMWARWQRHPLWRIHRLSNNDKHRIIAVVPYSFMFSAGFENGHRVALTVALRENLDEDPKIPIPMPDELAVQFNFKVEPTFAIVLQNADADTGLFMEIRELPSLHQFVRDEVFPAVTKFAP